MEPPGDVPPDRDQQLVVRSPQQQQLIPLQQARPALALNLVADQHQSEHTISTIATSPSTVALIAVSSASSITTSSNNAFSVTTTSTSNAFTVTANVGTFITSSSSTSTSASASGSHPALALASTATVISAPAQAATALSVSSIGQHSLQQLEPQHRLPHRHSNASSTTSSLHGGSSVSHQQTIEKLSRPMAFDKMESIVREMQDPEHGVPVRQQKMFLTSIPYAFMGYDLIEWLMDRLLIEESEALNIANQLCLHGYFFPVNDTKTLNVKDDSSLYRFQTPYYWPWQHKAPDNVEYAIYLAKRSLRNKQRHALEDYEAEALTSLHKNLKGKWEIISMQAEEQVRLAKERKKGDKIVGDSQERAYWRVHRPPPGQFTPLEPCPVPSRDRQGSKQNKKKTVEDLQREVDYLKKSLNRTRMKMSQACESLVSYSETFAEYDFFLQPVLPSNPWVTEDTTFWQLNNTFVDIPTEKRVKRWAISIEELVSDPTGLQEFTAFLEKEYSHENIRFWIAVNRLRRSAHSQVARKVNEIYEEFLKPGAPCEINIDGKTMESVLKGLKNPSRFTFDAASEHIYMLLLKKDCYPRFIRSDHYKRLLETGIQPSHKKRFFNFGGVGGAKKKMTAALSAQPNLVGVGGEMAKVGPTVGGVMMHAPPPGSLARRRGSDRSLTGSAHELAVIGVNKESAPASKVPHSHSQSNLSDIPYRETPKTRSTRLETTVESSGVSAVCPWDLPDEPADVQEALAVSVMPEMTSIKLSVCPWEQETDTGLSGQRLTSTLSDNTEMGERLQRNLGIRHQHTVDSGEASMKRLIPNFTEQRRASVSFTPSCVSEYQFGRPSAAVKTSPTPSPSLSTQNVVDTIFPPLLTPLQGQSTSAATCALANILNATSLIAKDPPSSSDIETEEELNKLSVSDRNSESSTSELPLLATPAATPTPPPLPITKITPPPPEELVTVETQTQGEASVRDSSPSESFSGEHVEVEENVCVEAGSETEIEAVVQEVQIELIEAAEFEQDSDSNELPQFAPTVHVMTTPAVPAPNSPPLSLPSNLEWSRTTSGDGELPHTSPIKVQSAAQTPERGPTGLRTSSSATAVSDVANVGESAGEEETVAAQQVEIGEVYDVQEELSPTTDEYQECMQFRVGRKDVYDYDILDTEPRAGYIAPAPTPAPSMAPLAEMDADTVDDEFGEETAKGVEPIAVISTPVKTHVPHGHLHVTEEVKKRRKKRNSESRKTSSMEDKEKEKEREKASTSAAVAGVDAGSGAGVVEYNAKAEADRNAVCPWEDENVSTSDGTFVKTYATLGYL